MVDWAVFHEFVHLSLEFFIFASVQAVVHVFDCEVVSYVFIHNQSGVVHIDIFFRVDELLLVEAVLVLGFSDSKYVEDSDLVCHCKRNRRYKHNLALVTVFCNF